ncbi:MAG: YqgE/AlgH family protein [Acidimicrobiales bacterium]
MDVGSQVPQWWSGRLLVASPIMGDPNFERTVLLLLEHGEGGALGLVLNRPSQTSIDAPLSRWRDQATAPGVVFVGGPVSADAAICLAHAHRAAAPTTGWQPLFAGLGTLDVGLDPSDIGVAVDGLRLFAGYAGWSAGQLEEEVGAGAWFIVDAEAGDALSEQPADLWRRVLHRQRGAMSAIANFPADLSQN